MDEKISFLDVLSKQCDLEKSLAFGKPYCYKGITFYPVGLEYLIEFYTCVGVLMVKKERSKDRKLIKLPYMWFLFYAFENYEAYGNAEYAMYVPLLFALLEMVTKTNDFNLEIERKDNGDYTKCSLFINGVEINYKDFMEIRQVIFEQAGIEYSDEFINEDTEKAMNMGRVYEQQQDGYIPPNLENLIDVLSMYLHKGVDELAKILTIRKFNNLIRYISSFEDWKLLRGAELGGFVTFNKSVSHWIAGFEEHDLFKGENTDYHNSNLFKV